MSKFISDKTKQIDLGDGEWVRIPCELSFEDCAGFANKDGIEGTIDLLEKFIKEWNFKDDEGVDVPLNRENIRRLKIDIIIELQQALLAYVPKIEDKKKP